MVVVSTVTFVVVVVVSTGTSVVVVVVSTGTSVVVVVVSTVTFVVVVVVSTGTSVVVVVVSTGTYVVVVVVSTAARLCGSEPVFGGAWKERGGVGDMERDERSKGDGCGGYCRREDQRREREFSARGEELYVRGGSRHDGGLCRQG